MTATECVAAAKLAGERFQCDAFISYSHAVDSRLAPALHSALHRGWAGAAPPGAPVRRCCSLPLHCP